MRRSHAGLDSYRKADSVSVFRSICSARRGRNEQRM